MVVTFFKYTKRFFSRILRPFIPGAVLLFLFMVIGLMSPWKLPADPGKSPAFLVQRVSDDAPFMNQRVLYALELYQSRSSEKLSLLPRFGDNMLSYPLGQDYREEMVQGQLYSVARFRAYVFPQISGRITIPSQTVRALVAEPVHLIVRSIPETSGSSSVEPPFLIAPCSVELSSERRPVRVGESRRIVVTLRSEGDMSRLELQLRGTDGLKVYREAVAQSVIPSGDSILFQRIFAYNVVPLHEGDVRISTGAFRTFNPSDATSGIIRPQTLDLQIIPPAQLTDTASTPARDKPSQSSEPLERIFHYQEPNAMERLLENFSVSSLLLIAFTAVLTFITVQVHRLVRRKHTRDTPDPLERLKSVQTLSELNLRFREGISAVTGGRSDTRGLKQLIREQITDSDQRLLLESLLNDLSTELYSAKEPTPHKLNTLRKRALRLLQSIN